MMFIEQENIKTLCLAPEAYIPHTTTVATPLSSPHQFYRDSYKVYDKLKLLKLLSFNFSISFFLKK